MARWLGLASLWAGFGLLACLIEFSFSGSTPLAMERFGETKRIKPCWVFTLSTLYFVYGLLVFNCRGC